MPVVRALTALPVTVVPSHLHFDHVGALGRFEQTALLDAAPLRSRLAAGRLTLSRYEFLGFMDHLPEPSFAVDQWWADGAVIELGGRQVTVLATPGHTPDSLSLYDLQRRQLYTGDFLYPGHLYAHLPGASLRAYRATAHRLLALIDPATRLYTAHMADPPALPCAPVLEVADLAALARTLDEIAAGTRAGTAFYPRQYPVRGAVSLYTGLPWPAR